MNRTDPTANAFLAAAGLCALLALPSATTADETTAKSIEQLAAESITTAAQHRDLAAHYRAKAAEARTEVNRHRTMATSFMNSKSPASDSAMRAHCKSLADAAQQSAAEYDALAAIQDEAAKTTTE